MSSLLRTISHGKDKEQPAPAFDPAAIKRTISRPQALAPKRVIDGQIRQRKARRELEEQAIRSTSPTSRVEDQPSRAIHHRTWSWRSAFFMKSKMEIITLDLDKPLPPIPRPKDIHVTVNRKSIASSYWGCAGPQDAEDMAVMTLPPPTSFKFIEPQPGIRFRNEEEAREACRVIATLRESYFDSHASNPSDRCSRNCQKCAQRIAHSRQPSEDSVIPGYRIIVTQVDEDPLIEEEVVMDKNSEETSSEIGHFQEWVHGFGLFFLNTLRGPSSQ